MNSDDFVLLHTAVVMKGNNQKSPFLDVTI